MKSIHGLKKELDKYKTLAAEHEYAAKLLVRRDIELSQANERLEELDQIKSEFVSIVAHQLRTPLSAIKWILKLLLDEDLGKINEEQKKFLQKGYESNERLIHLINDMLNVSRIDAGKFKYIFTYSPLDKIVEDVISEIQEMAEKKHITITFLEMEKSLPLIRLDTEKIRLVLQNIMDNAIKYTPIGGKIIVKIKKKGKEALFSVQDSGIGIPDDQKKSIFTKFFRGTNAAKIQTEGSGLGLFISKNIIQKHWGKIGFESAIDKGSTFYFTLPLK